MQAVAAGLSDVGLQREHNEDSFVVLKEYDLYVVADGMGGHRAGDVASRIATETISEFFRSTANEDVTWPFHFDTNLSEEENRLLTGIRVANRQIFERSTRSREYHGMGTTVVGAMFSPQKGRMYIGHVGDSRCYRVSGGAHPAPDARPLAHQRLPARDARLDRRAKERAPEERHHARARHAGSRRRRPAARRSPPGRRVRPLLRRTERHGVRRATSSRSSPSPATFAMLAASSSSARTSGAAKTTSRRCSSSSKSPRTPPPIPRASVAHSIPLTASTDRPGAGEAPPRNARGAITPPA